MEETLKKFVYTGVALSSFTADRLKASIDTLVSDDKLTAEEGKKIIDSFVQKAESRKAEWEGQVKETIEGVLNTFKKADNSRVEDLQARLDALESKMS